MTDTGAKSAPRSRRADDRWMRSILRGQKFEGRLFMTETELQNISGIGAGSLAEILHYRKQHLSGV